MSDLVDQASQKQAALLLEALPYMQKYAGRTIVVKYGGNAMTDDQLKLSVMRDLSLLQTVGIKIVLVHGGGPAINRAMEQANRETHFIDGLRYTDEADLQLINAVLSGEVNKSLVAGLIKSGAKAVGFSGVDGSLIQAKQRSAKLGYVGDVMKINPDLLTLTLDQGYMPVIASIGVDSDGQLYNINADTAAAEIAAALGAQSFVLMTNVRGILQDPTDPDSLYRELAVPELQALIASETIQGGMIPKLKAIIQAMRAGLHQAVILDGRVPHALLLELFSDRGYGSLISD
ncbi:acetylglutamate kinase [Oenococcus kitaharae]|uniref:Acetylglutamate kinase n=1 Tax=Oenococcus kitaharae DSM 17330 TaxID=1045004 RepID=G9WJE1_9LACO|nr:acetylglutamate kinase [Oenococcus kitaharae]EHN58747.1 Acetylglutamate kinase [Oenococcus kitaharae DSM 17330]OEY81904.1 acetylglutamate kinase [Oenococcus kitaharae]OEY82294.1 acetylglutamate kinase [Oenococcus kitaharae]OEY82520.1 acetylglutamate kinase [Oenococcus kitaharae]